MGLKSLIQVSNFSRMSSPNDFNGSLHMIQLNKNGGANKHNKNKIKTNRAIAEILERKLSLVKKWYQDKGSN